MLSRCRRTITVGLSAALLVAACGGDDDEGATTSTPGEIEALEPIEVSYQPAGEAFIYLVEWVTREYGFFEDEGLQVDIGPIINNASQVAQMVASGEADFALVGGTGALNAIAANQDLVVLGTTTRGSVMQVVISAGAAAELADRGITPDSPVEDRMEALRGLTLAIPAAGSSIDALWRSAAAQFGLNPDEDMTLQPLTDTSGMAGVLKAGAADGIVLVPPVTTISAIDGSGVLWIDATVGELPDQSELDFIDVVTSKGFLDDNPDAVERYMRALWRGYEKVLENSAETKERIRGLYFPDMPETVYDAAYTASLANFRDGITPTHEGFDQLLSVFNIGRDAPVDLQFDDVYDVGPVTRTEPK